MVLPGIIVVLICLVLGSIKTPHINEKSYQEKLLMLFKIFALARKKRRKRARHEHHGGAWKVAFADFMAAMFALFLVLRILSQSQDAKSAASSYFRHATDYEGKADETLRGNQGLQENKQGRLDLPNNFLDVDAGNRAAGSAIRFGRAGKSHAGGRLATANHRAGRGSGKGRDQDFFKSGGRFLDAHGHGPVVFKSQEQPGHRSA